MSSSYYPRFLCHTSQQLPKLRIVDMLITAFIYSLKRENKKFITDEIIKLVKDSLDEHEVKVTF